MALNQLTFKFCRTLKCVLFMVSFKKPKQPPYESHDDWLKTKLNLNKSIAKIIRNSKGRAEDFFWKNPRLTLWFLVLGNCLFILQPSTPLFPILLSFYQSKKTSEERKRGKTVYKNRKWKAISFQVVIRQDQPPEIPRRFRSTHIEVCSAQLWTKHA